jgi:hypothetical protein
MMLLTLMAGPMIACIRVDVELHTSISLALFSPLVIIKSSPASKLAGTHLALQILQSHAVLILSFPDKEASTLHKWTLKRRLCILAVQNTMDI